MRSRQSQPLLLEGKHENTEAAAANLVDDLTPGPVSGALALDVIWLASAVDLVSLQPAVVARRLEIDAVRPTSAASAVASETRAVTIPPVDARHRVLGPRRPDGVGPDIHPGPGNGESGAVVPAKLLRCAVEFERLLQEALFGQRLRSRANPVLISTT